MEIKDNDDGTFELTESFRYQDGIRIITICGCKKHNKLEVDVSITPLLKGRQAYVCDLYIHTDVEIVNGDIRVVDESLFDDYPKYVIESVKKLLKKFSDIV